MYSIDFSSADAIENFIALPTKCAWSSTINFISSVAEYWIKHYFGECGWIKDKRRWAYIKLGFRVMIKLEKFNSYCCAPRRCKSKSPFSQKRMHAIPSCATIIIIESYARYWYRHKSRYVTGSYNLTFYVDTPKQALDYYYHRRHRQFPIIYFVPFSYTYLSQ